MKANSYIKLTNMIDRVQLYFDSSFRGNNDDRNLQKRQLDRRHPKINWRWQSRLMNRIHLLSLN